MLVKHDELWRGQESKIVKLLLESIINLSKYTPLKFNMEPEKKSLEKEIPFGNHHFHSFSGSMLNFGEYALEVQDHQKKSPLELLSINACENHQVSFRNDYLNSSLWTPEAYVDLGGFNPVEKYSQNGIFN